MEINETLKKFLSKTTQEMNLRYQMFTTDCIEYRCSEVTKTGQVMDIVIKTNNVENIIFLGLNGNLVYQGKSVSLTSGVIGKIQRLLQS